MDTKLIVNTEDLPAGIFSGADIAPHSFLIFQPQNEEIMRLDKEGMIFMGERITDAGEAYAAWMKTMAMMQGVFGDKSPDAKLRDSAPVLLEALDLMVATFCDTEGSHGAWEKEAIDKARAAIKKATGE